MSFISFLKQVGLDIVKGVAAIAGFEPLATTAVPSAAGTIETVVSDLQQVAGIIVSVEAVGTALAPNMTGAQKLSAATPLVAQIILKSDMMIGHKIVDQALFTNGAEQVASGIVNVLNSLEAKPLS